MDFFEHQDRARRNTGLLVVYFCIAVVLIIVAVYLAIAGILFYGQSRGGDGQSLQTLWFPDVFAAVSVGTLIIVTAGSLYKIAELSGGGEKVALALGGRPVLPNTRDLSERVLLNVVEEMALASGTPVPPVYLLEESAINAFAAGTSAQNAVIGVTRGAINTLKRDELQGVIAHEFSHILNGDMRLNIRLMGVLNGILLIAIIGYFLMRTSNRSSYSNSDSSEKKGGNPLPLIGFCLYVIGYIGIFFGHLIKSAVSRQREFLADASAVQFTRYPSGIAGALKKIGGLITGSRLETPNAEEASHMFFGNALRASFLNMLSTHPPLPERIRRIEPNFDGEFPQTVPIEHTASELIDPSTLAQRRGAPASVHAAAVAGAQGFAFDPAAAVAQVGAPQIEHIDYANDLIASLPPELSADVRDPLGAVATIYALLLDDDEPDVREKQIEYLSTRANPRAFQETARIAPVVLKVNAEAKLPLVCMVLPALHELSPQQLIAFRDDVTWLIKADKQVSLFEYAVHRLVLKRLVPRLERQPAKQVRYTSLAPLADACSGLLSTLAYASGDEESTVEAYGKGATKLFGQGAKIRLLPPEQTGLKVVDAALDQLAGASPQIKKRVIEACAECIGADAHVTIEEAELLRVISDALDCPMPPLVDRG